MSAAARGRDRLGRLLVAPGPHLDVFDDRHGEVSRQIPRFLGERFCPRS